MMMIFLVLVLTLAVITPVHAKGTSSSNDALIKQWEENGLFTGLKNEKKNPNASMSKIEFSALMNNLFGYGWSDSSKGHAKKGSDVIEVAKKAGYWDEIFAENEQGNSSIKTEDALQILTYLFPDNAFVGANDQELNSKKPMNHIQAIQIIDQQIDGLFNKEGTYSDQTIKGNALINQSDITLENTTIKGDLFVTAGAIDGNITLENVIVSGTVYITKAQQNKVQSVNSILNKVVIYEPGETKSDWTLVWSDEFISNEIDPTKWTYDIGNWIVDENGNGIASGWGNNELEYYTDSQENSYIEAGKLVIKAQKEENPVEDKFGSYDYTSAKLKTKGLFSKKYGKFEANIKLPEGQGYWPGFWMMPEDDVYGGWPTSGEIDIMEAAGKDTTKIGGTIHYGEQYPNNTYKGTEYHFPEGEDFTGFHTYGIEWEPGEIRWYVDGQLYQTLDNWFSQGTNQASKYAFPAPFDQEFYMIMNLGVGGWYGGNPDDSTQFPGEMEVDYVRVYELTGRDYKEPIEPILEKEELPDEAKHPLEDGNLIYDNDFKNPFTIVDNYDNLLDPTYWNFVYLPDFSGDGGIVTEEIEGVPFAKMDVNNAGNALWAIQLIQKIAIVEGGTYKLSFDAKSDSNRNIMTKVSGGAERGYANYSGEQTISLTDHVESYEYTFTLNQETDVAARLEFNIGSNGNAPVWVGNVRVEEFFPEDPANMPKTPLADGNHLYNGTFDQGDMTRLNFWELEVDSKYTADMRVSESTRELKVAITDGGDSSQSVQLKQTGLQFLKGNSYELTFDARASEGREIEVEFLSEDGTVSYSESVPIVLTTQMDVHTVEFTMTKDYSDVDGQLFFRLGGQSGDIYLDNAKLIQTSEYIDYSQVDLYPLKNGEFSSGLDSWDSYVHFDALASVDEQKEELQANIENAGNETWSIQVYQENMKLSKGVTYVLSFDASSTADREIEVAVENAGYHRYFEKLVSLHSEMNSYNFEFVMTGDDTVTLKFLLGKFAQAHEITIDNVVLEVKNAEELE